MNYSFYKRSIFATATLILFSISAIVAEILPRADTLTSPHKYARVQRGGSVIVQDESGISSNSTLDSTASFELSTSNDSNDIDVTMEKKGLKVLFLSADTGGGHRYETFNNQNDFVHTLHCLILLPYTGHLQKV